MNLDLTGKRALVGGGSQGLGEACARELASLGAEVVVLARSEAKLEAVCQHLPAEKGQKHSYIAVDAADTRALVQAVSDAVSKGGAFHIWVNNTGGPAPGPAHMAEPEAFAAAFNQHVVSSQSLLQVLLPGMREAGYGRILNVLSTSVKQAIPNLGVSNTIRAAVGNWAKTLARELAPDGITVNNVLPGQTRTARLDGLVGNLASTTGKSPDDVRRGMLANIPMGRFAKPEEFASAVAFLASPAASFITGINLPVDGGSTASL